MIKENDYLAAESKIPFGASSLTKKAGQSAMQGKSGTATNYHDDKREVEPVWNSKTSEVCNIVLPFQVIEQVDEPRAEKPEDTPVTGNVK